MAKQQTPKRPPEHVEEPRPKPIDARLIEDATGIEITAHLLRESLQRLEAARELERTRKIVYPETTAILRDCERLSRKLRDLKQGRDARAAYHAGERALGGYSTHEDAPGNDFDDVDALDPSQVFF